MRKYTYKEMLDRIAVLQEFYPEVRLVNPRTCKILEIVETDGVYTLRQVSYCFEEWKKTYQCWNCVAARALRRDSQYAKYEVVEDKVYHVLATPVELEGEELALAFVRPLSIDLDGEDAANLRSGIVASISGADEKILKDMETKAFNRVYLSEHLPYILKNAHNQHIGGACMVQIQQFAEISEQSGKMAALGLVCSLYDILEKTFAGVKDVSIVRFSEDAFIIFNTYLERAEFTALVAQLEKKALPAHILFQNAQIPFAIKLAYTDMDNEDITDEESFLKKLMGLLG